MLRKVISVIAAVSLLSVGFSSASPAAAITHPSIVANITGLPSGCHFDGGCKSGDTITSPYGYARFNIQMSCGAGNTAVYNFVILGNDPTSTVLNYAIPDVKFQDFTGHADTSFAECLSAATYHLGWTADQYTDDTSTFSVDQTLDVSINPDSVTGDYAFTAPVETPLINTESDNLGDAKAGECLMSNNYSSVTFAAGETTYNLNSNVAQLNAALDVPASKTGLCQFAQNLDSISKFDTVDNLSADSEDVVCGGITRSLPVQFDQPTTIIRGQTFNGVVHVPDYALIEVSGQVNEFYADCLTGLSMYVSSPDGYQVDQSAITVNGDGTYSVSLPKGTWTFGAGGAGGGTLAVGNMDPCMAETTVFVGGNGSTQTVDLTSTMAIIKLIAAQPAGHDDCVVGDVANPSDLVGIKIGDTKSAASVTCGSYSRTFSYALPAGITATNPPTEVNVAIPSPDLRHVTGSFTVPPSIKTTEDQQSVSIVFGQVWGDFYSTSGWLNADYSDLVAQLDWANMTYSADLPQGAYTARIQTSLPDSSLAHGCYPTSFYAGPNKTATWSGQLAAPVTVSAGISDLTLPTLALKVGAHIRTTWDYPASVRPWGISLNLFNADKQRDNEPRGAAAQSSDAYYDFYCVAPGTYYVNGASGGVSTQYFSGATSIASAKPVIVRADGTADPVHFTFYPISTGSISGTIVDLAGVAQSNMTGYTVWASGSNGSIGSAQVDASGNFRLQGLETKNVYRLVVAKDSEFGNNGVATGGKNFTFYGNTHVKADASLIALTANTSNVEGLKFTFAAATENAALSDVSPIAGISQPNPPADDLAQIQSLIDSGVITLDSPIIAPAPAGGYVSLNATVNFNGLKDTAVDMYLVSNADISPTVASVRVNGAAVTHKTAWLGRVSIVNNKVKLPTAVKANLGLNQIVLVGRSSSTKVAYPLVVGKLKPTLIKKLTLAGLAKKGKTLAVSGGKWIGSPSKVALTYSWFRCAKVSSGCKVIAGAKKPSYKLGVTDSKKFIKVVITAKNSAGSTSTYLVSAKAN